MDVESPPALLRSRDCAALCSVSEAAWRNLNASGSTPAPIRLGRSVRWARSEILAWIDAGAPPRHRWEAARKDTHKLKGTLQ